MKINLTHLSAILVSLSLLSCKPKRSESQENIQPVSSEQTITTTESYSSEPETTDGYKDGDYCATIEYYNSSTGASSTYTLEVEVEGGELVRINWTNGGWLDSSHFSPPEVDADGSCSFSTYDGKDYEVQIDGAGGCDVSYSPPEDDEEEETETVESEENESETFEENSIDSKVYNLPLSTFIRKVLLKT